MGQLKFYLIIILEEAVGSFLSTDNMELENKKSRVTFREMHHFAAGHQPHLCSFLCWLFILPPLHCSISLLASKSSHNLLILGVCKRDIKLLRKSKCATLRSELILGTKLQILLRIP